MSPLVWVLLAILFPLIIFEVYLRLKLKTESDQVKVLNLLQKLSDIIISSISDIEVVAQRTSDVIAFDLGFQVGVILLKDEQKPILRRVAISRTQRVEEAVNKIGFHFKGLETPLSQTDNITVAVFLDGVARSTQNIYDVLQPHVSLEQAKYIQEMGELATSLVYPIYAKGKKIGVMIFSLSKKDQNFSEIKRKIVVRVLEEVGIALDSARVYQDLKITGQKLEYANQRLKELDKLKDDFVSITSHELRTPMTAIKSYAWMSLNKSDIPLSAKLKRYLERTLISTERLINLVNDMLNISRIESGRIEIIPEVFDIQELAKEVLEEISQKAKEKNLKLRLLGNQVLKVFAEKNKVHQVLLNLVGNSLKFSPQDGFINISFFSDGEMVEISVEDNGVGISKDDLSRLFKKFGKLDNSYVATATSGGTGLGLYICKSLVELMHGKIWAYSEGLGKGSKFTFSLPVANRQVLENKEKYTTKAEGEVKLLEPAAF